MKSKLSLYILISLFFIFISTSALSDTVSTVSPNPGLAGDNFTFRLQTDLSSSDYSFELELGDGGGGWLSQGVISLSEVGYLFTKQISKPGIRLYRYAVYDKHNGDFLGYTGEFTYEVLENDSSSSTIGISDDGSPGFEEVEGGGGNGIPEAGGGGRDEGKPDLILSIIEESIENNTINYLITIKNIGSSPTRIASLSNSLDNIQISRYDSEYIINNYPTGINNNDHILSIGIITRVSFYDELYPGESYSFLDVVSRINIPTIKYTTYVLDSANLIDESNELNNTFSLIRSLNTNKIDTTPPTLELISIEGLKNDSIPATNTLTVKLKASGDNLDRIDVDWLGDGSDVSSLHATDGEIIEFTHIYSRSDLDGYFDDSVGFSRRLVAATATAYGNSEDVKSEMLSSDFTVYDYTEWLNSTILAPKFIKQGEELSIYVSKNRGINVNIDNVYIRYREQGAKKSKSINNIGGWSPPVPFNKIATDYFYFYFPDTGEVSGTYEYQIKPIINNNIPELDINWSDIKTISFEPTSGEGSIDTSGTTSLTSEQLAIIDNTRKLLKDNEKTIFDYLDDVEKLKYSVSYISLEVFKIVIDEELGLDVDEIEDEIKQAIEEVDLNGIISKEELTSLILDLSPYIGTGKSGIQLFSGYDIVTKEEISRFLEGISLSADALSSGVGGRFVKLVKHSDKINKVSKIIPKIVHIVVKNRIIGKNAEILLKSKLANTYGSLELGGTLITDYGRRFFDLVSADGLLAIESKVGRVSATKFTKKQILKDIEALKLIDKNKIVWIFTESPTTGKSGWTSGLEKFKNEGLEKLGFPENAIEFKNSNLDPKSIATESIN